MPAPLTKMNAEVDCGCAAVCVEGYELMGEQGHMMSPPAVSGK